MFAVASRAEQEEWKARLRAHGVHYSEEDHARQHSLYFTDPNGIMLEVTSPASAAPQEAQAHALETVERWLGVHEAP